MQVNRRRRALLLLGLTATAGGLAACTRTLRDAQPAGREVPSSATTPSTSTAGPATVAPAVPTTSRISGTSAVTASSTTARSSTIPRATTAIESQPGTTARTTRTTLTTTRLAPVPTGPARQVDHGVSGRPEVALTFHGAGDPALARQILQIVRAGRARITVMVVGTWLADNPGIGREILAGGHELGNHTWSHDDINSLGPDQQRQEVIRCRDLLRRNAGVSPGYFRQSQSQTASDQLRGVAGQAGYRVCLSYDLDSMDWTDPGGQAVRDNLRAARAGSVVSMHLGHQSTVDALPGILADLQRSRLTPVTASVLLA